MEKNTYKKYCPNVFVAVCSKKHKKGDFIIITTKYGKENEHEIHNFVGYMGTKENPLFCYSITRVDGFNVQERAKKKAEKLNGYALNANKRSASFYEDSQEGKEFLSLGEPIKIGHHSERKHRALIKRNWDRMAKSVAESEKAKDYINRSEYWNKKAKEVNLSMPESLSYFEFKLEEAQKKHKYLKENPNKRQHSYSLTYAKKEVNNMQKKLNLAIKLWGTDKEIKNLQNEKKHV